MKTSLVALFALVLTSSAALAEFRLSFDWGDIPLCTTGRPNTVGNPAFILTDVPAGTETIEFRLVDLDVPSYNHGGGRLRISGSGTVPEGLFTYRSPCPPGQTHTYEWRATARAGNQVLGEARAERRYPE
ncbi:phospholipid-binding protein [Rhodophyticola sp. CCM32]|uniref:phospholipid-binding protein n=1 Tax=Rhodophyticola sp. CCM32 TaxID=2916397 RepID=UPI00107F5332|nr:phospholipid-binding protein [Rhodophyticola sp. CCM32]QBY01840.1 phospholipid-binding protein [Rhodophyticola sp. CCM32]